LCNDQYIPIVAVDFFVVADDYIQPYQNPSGFDASSLLDELADSQTNAAQCNAFIQQCYEKIAHQITGLYFAAVLHVRD
jgi:hypothetical protein